MRSLLSLAFLLLLTACASPPPVYDSGSLFRDERFAAPSEPIEVERVLALDDAMRRYVDVEIAPLLRREGPLQGLIDALYRKDQLKLRYDASRTRNASEAFAARSGNCLSLVIMTAAFARHLGLEVRYQSVRAADTWSRSGDLVLQSGHVNVTLGPRRADARQTLFGDRHNYTIDFLPQEDLLGQRTRSLDERTIVAMVLNNRAAEALARGRLDDAYAWVRASIRHDPHFGSALNTLGVVYLRHGDLDAAEQALQALLKADPEHPPALSNLAQVMRAQGRDDAAQALQQRLARVEARPPFQDFDLALEALRSGDLVRARDHLLREIAREGGYHELHFWLAVALNGLGDTAQARRHLIAAMEASTDPQSHDLYAAKLARLSQRPPARGGILNVPR